MRDLAPVTLLLGPPEVTGAMAGLLHDESGGVLYRYSRVSAEVARGIVEKAPIMHRSTDFYVIDLNGSSEQAQNILLKLLEEPPSHCRFVLMSQARPLATIISRSRVVHLATPVAMFVQPDADAARARSVVATAIRAAVQQGIGGALDKAVRNWGPEHTAVLHAWAMEAASSRWVAFTEDFAPGVSPARALHVIEVLSQYSSARTGGPVALASMARGSA